MVGISTAEFGECHATLEVTGEIVLGITAATEHEPGSAGMSGEVDQLGFFSG